MAKVQKYNEEMMVEAVIQYAAETPGKITAKGIAEWSNDHIPELKGVRDYHFLRPQKSKDKRGIVHETVRPCTVKIREINDERTVRPYDGNILLQSSDVLEFFKIPMSDQRELILKTRSYVESLVKENKVLREKSTYSESKLIMLQDELDEMTAMAEDWKENYRSVIDTHNRLLKKVDKELGRQALASIGIIDGDIDIQRFKESRTEPSNKTFNIRKAISAESIVEEIGFDDQI